MLEGVFVFGGLSYLASSLTDRFGINYAYAGLMVAGFGCGGLVYSVSARRLVAGVGELGVLSVSRMLFARARANANSVPGPLIPSRATE